jgi:hypothetical protein
MMNPSYRLTMVLKMRRGLLLPTEEGEEED